MTPRGWFGGHAVRGLVPGDLSVGGVVPDAAVVVEVDGLHHLRLDLQDRCCCTLGGASGGQKVRRGDGRGP